jgi:hypothetical protein
VREELPDELPVVVALEHPVVDARVDPPHQRGLRRAERGVGAPGVEHERGRVQAEHRREPSPEQVAWRAGLRHGHQVHVLGRQRRSPAVEDVRHLLHAPEPGRERAAAAGVADPGQEVGVGQRPTVLDVLLPLGRDLAHQVPRGQQHVHLRVTEGVQGSTYLLPRRGGQDLVGDDHRARPGAHPLREPVPGADGLPLQTTPLQLHQVEGGEEVLVEPVGRVEDPQVGQPVAVPEEQVLDERRAGLGGADVHQYLAPRTHRAS